MNFWEFLDRNVEVVLGSIVVIVIIVMMGLTT